MNRNTYRSSDDPPSDSSGGRRENLKEKEKANTGE